MGTLSVIQKIEHPRVQPPIRRINQLRDVVYLLIELPRDPIDMENNLVFHTKPKKSLGYNIKPNFSASSLLYEDHVLRVCLDVHLNSPAKREEGL